MFVAAQRAHLGVGGGGVGAGASAAGAIGHDNAAEGKAGGVEAIADTGVGHDLDVVLVRADAKVGDAGEGGGGVGIE